MNSQELLKLESHTLNLTACIMALQSEPLELVERKFHDSVILRIEEMLAVARNMESKVSVR